MLNRLANISVVLTTKITYYSFKDTKPRNYSKSKKKDARSYLFGSFFWNAKDILGGGGRKGLANPIGRKVFFACRKLQMTIHISWHI